jgi:hypothetical protein
MMDRSRVPEQLQPIGMYTVSDLLPDTSQLAFDMSFLLVSSLRIIIETAELVAR